MAELVKLRKERLRKRGVKIVGTDRLGVMEGLEL